MTSPRVRACPRCGDRGGVQMIVYGLPRAPSPEEAERIWYAGCMPAVEPSPSWRCRECNTFLDERGRIVDEPVF